MQSTLNNKKVLSSTKQHNPSHFSSSKKTKMENDMVLKSLQVEVPDLLETQQFSQSFMQKLLQPREEALK